MKYDVGWPSSKKYWDPAHETMQTKECSANNHNISPTLEIKYLCSSAAKYQWFQYVPMTVILIYMQM